MIGEHEKNFQFTLTFFRLKQLGLTSLYSKTHQITQTSQSPLI